MIDGGAQQAIRASTYSIREYVHCIDKWQIKKKNREFLEDISIQSIIQTKYKIQASHIKM